MARTLFISDLHLDEVRPRIVALFERFLAEEAVRADRLYILGDLFESWVGDDSLSSPFPARVARAIGEVAGRTPTWFMHGNRDFLAGEAFSRAAGAALLGDPTPIDLYGTPALLMHGDTLCTDDHDYQAFRRQVRDPRWQQATLARPLEERLALARDLRARSESAKEGKAAEIMDVAPEAVVRAFRESGASLLIHGHTHRPARHTLVVGDRECTRWVLGDWYVGASFLEATPAGIRAIEFR